MDVNGETARTGGEPRGMETLLPAGDGDPARRPGLLADYCRQAAEGWLLSELPNDGRRRAVDDWGHGKPVLFPLGRLFSAVRLPGNMVLTLSGESGTSSEADLFLDDALHGGPVICDPRGFRYYALVPAGMPRTWCEAAAEWRAQGIACLGHGTYLGVPSMEADQPGSPVASYWSVPLEAATRLCAPLAVARLVAAGRYALDCSPDAGFPEGG